MTLKTAARQSLVARNAPIGPGSVHGAVTTTRFTRPACVATQAITAMTIGAVINGMIKIGFNTMGAPKIMGSLMLKSAGAKPVFPSAFE